MSGGAWKIGAVVIGSCCLVVGTGIGYAFSNVRSKRSASAADKKFSDEKAGWDRDMQAVLSTFEAYADRMAIVMADFQKNPPRSKIELQSRLARFNFDVEHIRIITERVGAHLES